MRSILELAELPMVNPFKKSDSAITTRSLTTSSMPLSSRKPTIVIFCCPKCNHNTHFPLLTIETSYAAVLASLTENPTRVKKNWPDPTLNDSTFEIQNLSSVGGKIDKAASDPTQSMAQKHSKRETTMQNKGPKYTWAEKEKWTNQAGPSYK